ncbi:DUF3455 domain-containing protein [Sphaerotilaceae bacterium SBD11-9]
MNPMNNRKAALAAASLLAIAASAHADVVTDWNTTAGELVVAAKLGTPPANRVMALVQTAVYDAVAAASLRQPHDAAAVDAAVAAANRVTLHKLIPAQEAAITAAYTAALARLPDSPARAAGIASGEQAATALLARRADDGAATPERYRPLTTAGTYVPTAGVAAPQWPQRKPWALSSASQFRPGPPPALASAQWARDYDEVKTLGAKASPQRTAEQTEVARFWDYSLPPIYHQVLRSVATAPGRSVMQNARLFATASQAMDDALIAVFDAKYHYNFWRPVTAIRNGDIDGNDRTAPEAGWSALIDTPPHPEYPSAHAVIAGALGAVLQAEAGPKGLPTLGTSSPTAQGATRRWSSVDDFTREVGHARIWAGIHYRTSTEVGLAMGKQVGAVTLAQLAVAPSGEPKLVERVAARGVQVYECRADAASPAGAKWVFVAPQAELFDAQGALRGTHYAGPHWEAADGSKIVGQVESRAEAPQAGAIPWLLLSTRSVGGAGRYAGVTRVQRVNTSGGALPAKGCDANAVGAVDRVPYTADYLLYASS